MCVRLAAYLMQISSISAELLPFNSCQHGDRRTWIFVGCDRIFIVNLVLTSRTLYFEPRVPNSLKTHAIATEDGPKSEFQYGGRHHIEHFRWPI